MSDGHERVEKFLGKLHYVAKVGSKEHPNDVIMYKEKAPVLLFSVMSLLLTLVF